MNAYHVASKVVLQRIEWEDFSVQAGHYEDFCPVDVVFAESRGQARAIFTKHYDLEYTAYLTITVLDQGVNRKKGIAPKSDPIRILYWGGEA